MKQKLVIVLLTGIISINLSAQFKGWDYGIKAGINISSVKETRELTDNYSSLIGGLGGAFVEMPISHNFSIEPELLYSQMGGKFQELPVDFGFGLNQYTTPIRYNFTYLNIPILVKYKILKTGVSVFAGPQIGFLLSAKEKDPLYSAYDIKSDYKKYDFSALLGVEYALPFGFNVSARYQLGFVNTSQDDYITNKNKALTFTLGYGFGKKKRR